MSNYERITVFVEQPELGTLDMTSNVVFNVESLSQELHKATEASVSRWGRFDRVTNRSEAELIVKPRLSTMVAWGDWSKSEADLQAQYKGLAGAALQDISREGLDLVVSLGFFDGAGRQVATSDAVGRQVSRKGELFTSARSNYGSASDRVQVANAKVDERRLPQVISKAVDTALIGSFVQLDPLLWQPVDKSGQRLAVRTTRGQRLQPVTTAPESIAPVEK